MRITNKCSTIRWLVMTGAILTKKHPIAETFGFREEWDRSIVLVRRFMKRIGITCLNPTIDDFLLMHREVWRPLRFKKKKLHANGNFCLICQRMCEEYSEVYLVAVRVQ